MLIQLYFQHRKSANNTIMGHYQFKIPSYLIHEYDILNTARFTDNQFGNLYSIRKFLHHLLTNDFKKLNFYILILN